MAFGGLIAQNMPRIEPVGLPVGRDCDFQLSACLLYEAVETGALQAFLFSNPCNPTGQLTDGAELQEIVESARQLECTLVADEFYSHYIYGDGASSATASPVSAARYIEDVDDDPVVIVDGITKNLRRPGWRLASVVGPASVIEQIVHVGAALDGGPSTLVQRAAMSLLCPPYVDRETVAIRMAFARKRALMLEGVRQIGIRVPAEPRGTFYVWGELWDLPHPLDDGEQFFQTALERRVVVVPGRFFDVNPARDPKREAGLNGWVRFSFGLNEGCLREGLRRLADLVAGASS